MKTDYKAESERTDADERALTPAFKRTPLYPQNPSNPLHQPQPWKASGNFTQAEADACNLAEFSAETYWTAYKEAEKLLNAAETERDKAKAHADKLAEALRDTELRTTQARIASGIGKRKGTTEFLLGELERIASAARAALAAYEEAQ